MFHLHLPLQGIEYNYYFTGGAKIIFKLFEVDWHVRESKSLHNLYVVDQKFDGKIRINLIISLLFNIYSTIIIPNIYLYFYTN